MKILSFGEILWDIYPDQKFIGGAPLNFAAHLAKHKEDIFMLSAVGQDDLGAEAVEIVKSWGISDRYIARLADRPTGQCHVTLDENMTPSYNLFSDVAYDAIPCPVFCEAFDVLYFGSLALRTAENFAAVKALVKHPFPEIFVDVNIRPPHYSKETVAFGVENATILKVSLEELPTVSGLLAVEAEDYKAFAKALAARYQNLKIILITLGEAGAFAWNCKENTAFFSPCVPTQVLSTVGAGDSFSAAFLHKYLHNADLQSCLDYANRVAAFVVSNYDAVPDYKDFT
jgi:fructokinase